MTAALLAQVVMWIMSVFCSYNKKMVLNFLESETL